jgi:hypothetical protein
MAQIADGVFRWAVKSSDGTYKQVTAAVPYHILDNVASPMAVYQDAIEGTPQGTVNDRFIRVPSNLVARGRMNEYLDLEFYASTGYTTTTANYTPVSLNVADIYVDAADRRRVDDKPRSLSDRYTKTGAGSTLSNAAGLADNPTTIANTWSAVYRTFAQFGHGISPRGYQTFALFA